MNTRKVVKNFQRPISSRIPKTPIVNNSAEAKGNIRSRTKVNRPRNTNDVNGRLKTNNNQSNEVKGKSVIQDTNEMSNITPPYKV